MKSLATFTWQELLCVTAGKAVSHHRPFQPAALESDSRTLNNNSFFVPLTGTNFNGNDYIENAYERNTEGSFVSSDYLESHPSLKRFPNLIAVSDPLIAYMQLARFHRRRSKAKIIAITGSSGKTTTKEMLYTMLSGVMGSAVQKSEKNFNNEVGVTQTLLNIEPSTEILILEMGMRGKGQIALLSEYAEPDIAVITNTGPAHIGLLGSIDAIIKAKCEIFTGVSLDSGLGIINNDDALLVKETSRVWNGRLETFSLHDVDIVHVLPEGRGLTFNYEDTLFSLGLPGSHNVLNAMACIKTCEELEIPLKKVANSLEHFEAGGGRWQKLPVEGFENLWVINDAYNANPASVKLSLAAFMDSRFPGLRKVAVLGGMAELGEFSEHYHREIGEWLNNESKLNAIIVVGEEAKPIADAIKQGEFKSFSVDTNLEAASLILENWSDNSILFIKASRAFHLDEIPELLVKAKNSHAVF